MPRNKQQQQHVTWCASLQDDCIAQSLQDDGARLYDDIKRLQVNQRLADAAKRHIDEGVLNTQHEVRAFVERCCEV